MPTAQIDPNFSAQTDKITEDLAGCADATLGKGQRPWVQPTDPPATDDDPSPDTWDGNPFSIPTSSTGIDSDFNRDALNQQYTDAIESSGKKDDAGNPIGGRIADRWVAKAQVDLLACQERAFRARNASYVRCAIHAAARRAGQGTSNGCFNNTRDYLAATLSQGYNEPNVKPVS